MKKQTKKQRYRKGNNKRNTGTKNNKQIKHQ